jgi:hypothetical protein
MTSSVKKEDVGERLHHADVGDILFRELLGNISLLFLCCRKHNGKNETGGADLVTGRAAVSLA